MAIEPSNEDYEGFSLGEAPVAAGKPQAMANGDQYEGFSLGKPAVDRKPEAVVRGPHTKFQQAGLPVSKEEPELTWGETVQQAGKNLFPSAKEAGASLYRAVTSPVETLGTLGQLGAGVASNIAGAIGIQQDPKKKAEVEALADALGGHYQNIYGGLLSGNTKAFKKALATDPASILMDVGTIAGGAGAAAKGLGLARTGKALTTAAGYVDPVQLALKAAKVPIAAVSKSMPYLQAVGTGKTAQSLQVAQQAGRTSDPILREAFTSHLTGKADAMEIVDAVENALTKIKDERSANYVANMAQATSGRLPTLPWMKIDREFSKQWGQTQFTPSGAGVAAPGAPSIAIQRGAQSTLNDIKAYIDWFKSQPMNSSAHTLEGFDALKKAIGEVQSEAARSGNPVALQKATAMYKSVLDTIGAQHPDYLKMMEAYQNASDDIANITQQLGAGRRGLSDASKLSKILSGKNNQTKQLLLKELAEYDPRIPYMLAGRELTERLPGGVPAYMSQAILGSAGLGVNPAFFGLQAAASSPRLAGRINQLGGTMGRLAGKATQQAVTTPMTLIGRASEGVPTEGTQETAPSNVAQRIREVEGTGKNPMSSARGPYQFIDSTFVNMFRKMYPDQAVGMSDEEIKQIRNTPEGEKLQEQMGPALIDENSNILRQSGKEPTAGNIYLMHFLGPRDAMKVLNSDPSAPVDRLLSNPVIAANRRLLEGKTAGEVVAEMERMMTGAATGGRIERASGGRVNNVDSLVDDLMGKFRKAKKETDKTTEPLLNAPDEHIVKALDVAQQAI